MWNVFLRQKPYQTVHRTEVHEVTLLSSVETKISGKIFYFPSKRILFSINFPHDYSHFFATTMAMWVRKKNRINKKQKKKKRKYSISDTIVGANTWKILGNRTRCWIKAKNDIFMAISKPASYSGHLALRILFGFHLLIFFFWQR